MSAVLEVTGLSTRITLTRSVVRAVDGVSLRVDAGETLGIVGESGCGKSMTGLSVMGLLPPGGAITGGSIRLDGRELTGLGARALRAIRGNEVAMVFQDPLTSLDPTKTIGYQVAEPVRLHRGLRRRASLERAAEVLDLVGLPRPKERLGDYPHQLSGGLRQRVMIAMALACEPKLLIADEPTTALDVTIQAQILDLLAEAKQRLGMAMILITHDMGVIASRADRVSVMHAGKVVETAGPGELFTRPRHSRTRALLASSLRLTPAAGGQSPAGEPRPAGEPLLRVRDLVKEYPLRRRGGGSVKAVSGVSFDLPAGETFGLVGESGCGKTTIGKMIVALERPDSGSVLLDGTDVSRLGGGALRLARRDLQLMFQDPYSSLDPRMRVGEIIREPLDIGGSGSPAQRRSRVAGLLDEVGLGADAMEKYPHEFSGGQRQRIGLARALALSPRVIVADEPVSALDVSIRAQVLSLMKRLQADHGLSYLVISHDLAVVKYLAERIGVMYLGKLVEMGPGPDVYERAAHPYTAGLIASVPVPDPAARRAAGGPAVAGELPSPVHPPSGCRFRTRCPLAQEICGQTEPELRSFGPGHVAACHFPLRTPEPTPVG